MQKVAGSSPVRPTTNQNSQCSILFFIELTVENCIISCFKLFSKVFDKLKPNAREFSTNSLSVYNATFRLFFIAFVHR